MRPQVGRLFLLNQVKITFFLTLQEQSIANFCDIFCVHIYGHYCIVFQTFDVFHPAKYRSRANMQIKGKTWASFFVDVKEMLSVISFIARTLSDFGGIFLKMNTFALLLFSSHNILFKYHSLLFKENFDVQVFFIIIF